MEKILTADQLESISVKVDQLKAGEKVEKTFKSQNETFVITIEKDQSHKLILTFKKAQDKILQALRHKEVEKDIMKARESYDHGSFFG